MAKATFSDGQWVASITGVTSSTKSITLATLNKFVDANIEIRAVATAGSYKAESGGSTNSTVTPSLGVVASATSTYGFTTTTPTSGSNGTNFLTLDPGATATSWTVTPKATITTAGYIPIGNTAGTVISDTPTIATGTNYYVPIVSPTFSGGDLSWSVNKNEITTTPTVTFTSTGSFTTSANKTTYGITGTAPSGKTDNVDYLTIDATSTKTNGQAKATVVGTRADIKYSNDAGVIAGHASATVITATTVTKTPTASIVVTVTDNFAPLYVPITTVSVGGGGLTENTSTNIVTTSPSVTISSTGSFTTTANKTKYGITSTTPTDGIEGDNYLTIDAISTTAAGSAKATVKITRAAVTYSNGAGLIAAHTNQGTTINTTTVTKEPTVSISPAVTDNFSPLYVPITNVSFTGGSLSTTTSTNVVSVTPSVQIKSSGSFTTTANKTTYGITSTAPSGKTDNVDYLTIDGTGTPTNGKATSTVKVKRAAATYTNAAGLIEAHNGSSVFSETSTPNITEEVTITPAVDDQFSPLYVPIVTATVTGGALSTVTNTNTLSVTPVIQISSSGAFKTASSYGVTTSKPSGTDGTNYLAITASGSSKTQGKTVSNVKVKRATVTYSNDPGLIAGHTNSTGISETTSNAIVATATFNATSTGNFSYYIPISTTSPGTTTVSGTTATRGSFSWTAGATTGLTIDPATFANEPTGSDGNYVDISNTTAAPVLLSGGKLYINRGYVDNISISLAKLVPDSISEHTIATTSHILPGFAAFDANGAPIMGAMTIYDGTYN